MNVSSRSTAEQQIFLDTARRFVDNTAPITAVRTGLGQPATSEYLGATGNLGWYASFVPEEFGGGSVSGHSVLDAVMLAEFLGAALQPAPTITMHLTAQAIARWGTPAMKQAVLPALASGERVGCYVFGEPDRGWHERAGLIAGRTESGYSLSGVVPIAPGLHGSDIVVVVGTLDGTARQFVLSTDCPGVSIDALECLDGTRPLARLSLDNVLVDPGHVLDDDGLAVAQQLTLALVLLTAESTGAMRRLFDMTLDYAKNRVAFGRTIGSFQAIKHLLADLSLLVELSTAIVDDAADALQHDRPDASELASVAKAYVSDAGIQLSQGCLQIHGGIGYTWEHDLHLYLRRLAADAALFGSSSWHREHLWHIARVTAATSITK
jgi:alkylation response protein AidB-like acyl-CoA dehydrogenase